MGLYNYINNYGDGGSTGAYTYIHNVGNSTKYGYKIKVRDFSGASKPVYGLNSYVERSSNNVNAYGVYSSVLADQTSGSSSPAYSGYFSISGSGSTKYALYATTNGSSGYAGYFNGDVTVTGSFIEASDESLKEDIEDIESATETLRNLRPKSYRFRSRGNNNENENAYGLENNNARPKKYGFLAHLV